MSDDEFVEVSAIYPGGRKYDPEEDLEKNKPHLGDMSPDGVGRIVRIECVEVDQLVLEHIKGEEPLIYDCDKLLIIDHPNLSFIKFRVWVNT